MENRTVGDGTLSMIDYSREMEFLVALKRREPRVAPHEVVFTHMPIWIQFRGLPFEWCTTSVLSKMGSKFGQILEVKPSFSGKSVSNVSRVCVCMFVANPVLPGFKATRKGKDPLWLNLKYERISHLCYNCGIIGSSMAMKGAPKLRKSIRNSGRILSPNNKRDQQYSPYKGIESLGKKFDASEGSELLDVVVAKTYSSNLKGVKAAHNQPPSS
ncbi:hypothetical protein FNV43_RR04260 [Rhamnella rubrinervis]|uniref:DUF4283 domain-containing protein n=1 Tax=Rhamnella rubrinervis TaxID=2594499 RepID=A0A8K0HKC8_9ROSA|nr:hypothetical protein FNV43_RR04260 [Rhamnella rubrinervis]